MKKNITTLFLTLVALVTQTHLHSQTVVTYSYTGSVQTFTVPFCVSTVTITCYGAQGAAGGAGGNSAAGGTGGLGAQVSGVYPVSAGNVLNIYVGGAGTGTAGGYNGGGNAGSVSTNTTIPSNAGGGGGASDVRLNGAALANRIITAGGGGGGGAGGCTTTAPIGGNGGAGGGGNGVSGVGTSFGGGGFGATGSSAGAQGIGCSGFSGTNGFAGVLGIGGQGGHAPTCCCTATPSGGGGGGGDVGGGGGGGGSAGTTGCSGNDKGGGGGGAGGTNFLSALFSSTAISNGVRSGNGLVTIGYAINGGLVSASASSTLICSGNTVSLTATGPVTNYTWNTGSNSSSITISPTTNTVITVSSTNSNACVSSSSVSIIVNSGLPSLSITSSTTQTCPGKTVTLTATGANTYTWSGGISNGVSFSPVSTNAYTVTGQNACGSSTSAVTVSVSPLPVSLAASSTIICAGNPCTLTASSSATSYTWQPINVITPLATQLVGPQSTTAYTVSATDGTCQGSAVLTVSVNPNPTITIANTSSIVCAGSTVQLTASGGNTYTWSPVSGSGPSIIVTPTTPSSYSVGGTNSFGCSSGTTAVVIALLGPVISVSASPSLICMGETTTIQATGAVNYSLNGLSSGASSVVAPLTTSIYSLSGDGSNGCVTTQTIEIDVFTPTTTVTGPAFICAGQTATLSGGGSGTTYTWSPGNIPLQTINVSPSATTIYTLTATSTSVNINCDNSATLQITVNPNPTVTAAASRSVICKGEYATLTASGASTYSWSTGANSVTTVVTPSLVTTYIYTVTGISSASCQSTATVFVKVLSCSPGFIELAQSNAGIWVYPNPASGYFNLEAERDMDLIMVNETGQLIKRIKVVGGEKNIINTRNIEPGIYYLLEPYSNGSARQKIMISE